MAHKNFGIVYFGITTYQTSENTLWLRGLNNLCGNVTSMCNMVSPLQTSQFRQNINIKKY